jgi:hypothetical protein
MLVLSLIVLSLQCVKFFYFVHRFREFCECFVVFFDKRIFLGAKMHGVTFKKTPRLNQSKTATVPDSVLGNDTRKVRPI